MYLTQLNMKNYLIAMSILLHSQSGAYETAPQQRPSLFGSKQGMKCPIVVVPKISLGPLQIGMRMDQVETLGMQVKAITATAFIVGKYSITINSERVISQIEMELGDAPNCLYYRNKSISKASSTQQLAKIFESCEPERQHFGGTIIVCKGILIGSGGWGGLQKTPLLRIVSQ